MPSETRRAVFEDECQAPKGEVLEIERCDTDDTNTHLARVASKKSDAHKPCDFKDPDVNDDGVDIREYAEAQIVRHTRSNGRMHHVVRWYGYMSKEDTVEPWRTFQITLLPDIG